MNNVTICVKNETCTDPKQPEQNLNNTTEMCSMYPSNTLLYRYKTGKLPNRNHVMPTVKCHRGPDYRKLERNIALDLVRVTEAAALSSARWLGKGNKNAADAAAVKLMRHVLNTVDIRGQVVVGEGEKDEAPMLYRGEKVGRPDCPTRVDIAVDPLDGTSLVAHGRNGAISVIALAERNSMFDPNQAFYMEKLVVGPTIPPSAIHLDFPVAQNLSTIAKYRNKPMSEVTVVMLDRPRHAKLIHECRSVGARIRLIPDGDVAAAIEVALPDSPIDVMMGVGGSPEGVIAAAALKILGGYMQARLWARNCDEKERLRAQGHDMVSLLETSDLCRGEDIFFALTGVTDGSLVKGVEFLANGAKTHSIVMRSHSGTVRYIESHHKWNEHKQI